VENDSDEMHRKVKQLLRTAKTLAEGEHKRLEEFAETLKAEFSQPNPSNEKNDAVSDPEQIIRSMIEEAKRHRITDAEAKVLMLYYASIKRANRDKLGRLASAGEFWDTARGILEWESVGEENKIVEEIERENPLLAANTASGALSNRQDTHQDQTSPETKNQSDNEGDTYTPREGKLEAASLQEATNLQEGTTQQEGTIPLEGTTPQAFNAPQEGSTPQKPTAESPKLDEPTGPTAIPDEVALYEKKATVKLARISAVQTKAEAYFAQYQRNRDPDDLDKAIRTGQLALEDFLSDKDRVNLLPKLAMWLKTRYESSGKLMDLNLALVYIELAIPSAQLDGDTRFNDLEAMMRNRRELERELDQQKEIERLRSREISLSGQVVGGSDIVTESTFTNFNPVGPGYAISRLS
jgi:hypothetical protein